MSIVCVYIVSILCVYSVCPRLGLTRYEGVHKVIRVMSCVSMLCVYSVCLKCVSIVLWCVCVCVCASVLNHPGLALYEGSIVGL